MRNENDFFSFVSSRMHFRLSAHNPHSLQDKNERSFLIEFFFSPICQERWKIFLEGAGNRTWAHKKTYFFRMFSPKMTRRKSVLVSPEKTYFLKTWPQQSKSDDSLHGFTSSFLWPSSFYGTTCGEDWLHNPGYSHEFKLKFCFVFLSFSKFARTLYSQISNFSCERKKMSCHFL